MFGDFQTAGKLMELLSNYMREHSIETLMDIVLVVGIVIYFVRKRFSKDRWL